MIEHPAAILKRIETVGGSLDRRQQRERLLTVGFGANIDKEAEYVILTGCHGPFSIAPVKYLVDLMRYFSVSYTFLSREDCCGKGIVEGMFQEGLKDDNYEAYSRRSLSNKITQAKDLGASAIVTVCPGCNVMSNRYNKDHGIVVLHYLDLILKVLKESKLSLKVDFYEGCHRWHRFVPDFQESIPENSQKVMARVEGLSFNEISSDVCCRFGAPKIFASGQTNTIVTPSSCCYSFLTQARSTDSPKVKLLTEILCESLNNGAY